MLFQVCSLHYFLFSGVRSLRHKFHQSPYCLIFSEEECLIQHSEQPSHYSAEQCCKECREEIADIEYQQEVVNHIKYQQEKEQI